jgi:hypothetical protein
MNSIIGIIKEFDGILGAILGSVATLITTDILRKKGKLNIYVESADGNYEYNTNGFISSERKENSDLYGYIFNLKIQIYNKSDAPKIIRNIKLNIYNNDKLVYIKEIEDEATRKYYQSISFAENATIYNIEPKKIYEYKYKLVLSAEELKKVKNNVTFELTFINEKNIIQKFKVFSGMLREDSIKKG